MLKSKSSQPNEYIKSSSQLDVMDTDNLRVVAGYANRTGLTGPGYPDRAVYQLTIRGQQLPDLHVLEDDVFVPRRDWYARQ